MTTFTALIPARGGSRGIPRKNLHPLRGKPLIAWTIEAALRSAAIEKVIVTTDDDEIAEVSRSCGAQVPFLRPAALASDEADSGAVVMHALDFLRRSGEWPSAVALLQPTSPLRDCGDIDRAAALYDQKAAQAVASVRRVEHPVQWLRRIDSDGRLVSYSETDVSRRQDMQVLYELNGAIYLVNADTFERERTFFPPRTFAYVMPPERSIDIDTLFDLRLASLLMSEMHDAE